MSRERCRTVMLAALAALCLPATVSAAPRAISVDSDTFGATTVLAPAGQPERFVAFVSDSDGLTPQRREEAEAIVARGAAVALIDLPKLQQTLAAAQDESCSYVFGDVEDLARTAQRHLGMTTWRWPILFGRGDGGTLAYLMLAQAPDNTAGGAVSIGFAPQFKGTRPLCPGAPMLSRQDGVISYKPFDDVPGPWVLVTAAPVSDAVRGFLDDAEGAKVLERANAAMQFTTAVDALFALSAERVGGLSDLPLVELPSGDTGAALFVLISGDGGWRDIDKQIGEFLAANGVSVIGVDALRYFWSRREPKQIASDLSRIVDHYDAAWHPKVVAIGGYSFGADAIPLAWPELRRETQDRVGTVVLLGLAKTADLQISVTGFLGIADANDIPLAPYLKALPKAKVLCFYGSDEAKSGDSACVVPELDGAMRVERPGGHHFDGDYEPVAVAIRDRLRR